ncbi:interleukin 15, like [Mobula birostris]|uniref:interleukin 15, like n=1 Tax=Mobula birostris TaxID=1983395 RepID=UPI003B28AB6C
MMSQYYCCLPLCVVMAMAQGMVGCLNEAIIDLDDLQKIVGGGGDISLYCPDLNFIEFCYKETLRCFKSELFVLGFEFNGVWKQNVSQLISKLSDRLEYFTLRLNASTGCQRCEIYDEKSAEIFLGNLRRLLQYLNRFSCSRLQL